MQEEKRLWARPRSNDTKGPGREGQEQVFGDWCLKLRESVSKKEEICFYKDKQVRGLRKIH